MISNLNIRQIFAGLAIKRHSVESPVGCWVRKGSEYATDMQLPGPYKTYLSRAPYYDFLIYIPEKVQ